jgi:hypothetical protein
MNNGSRVPCSSQSIIAGTDEVEPQCLVLLLGSPPLLSASAVSQAVNKFWASKRRQHLRSVNS